MIKMKRLAIAYAVAPIGAVVFVAALVVPGFGADVGSLVGAGLIAAPAWGVGALLVPVLFLLERLGKRGWHFYVPIASLAGLLVGPALESPGRLGGWRLALLCAIAGGASGIVFSYVLDPHAENQQRDQIG